MQERQTQCQSIILKVSRPYHWALAFLAAIPPPCFTYDIRSHKNNLTLLLIYALYVLLLLSLTLWISYVNSIHLFSFTTNFKLGILTNALTSAQSNIVFFVQALNQLMMLINFKQLLRIFNEMEMLEHDIRWHSLSQRLGVAKSVSYAEKNFRWQLFRKSGCMFMFSGIFHTFTNYALIAPATLVWYRMLICLSMVILQVKNVEFCVTVQLVHELLQQLMNELLFVRQQLIATVNLADRRCLYMALQHNQQCLSRIWRLVEMIGSYYSLPIMALFLYDALSITATVNWAYLDQFQKHDRYKNPCEFRMIFTANLLINMMFPCWLCQCCIELYDRFADVLHDLRSDGSDVRLSMCLREYSLQIMHQKLLFSCNGFFNINLKHFGARILTIMTYVVILIQFRLKEEAEKEREAELAAAFYRNVTIQQGF